MSVRAWFRLTRPANVWTAWADVAAGAAVALGAWPSAARFIPVLGASALLYAAGMVLNDMFDLERDRALHPDRPLPSGAVSRGQAALFGAGLMVGGVALAFAADWSGLVALVLAGAILVYDSALSHTVLGPVSMAACRFMNVLLGASLAGPIGSLAFAAAGAVAVHTASISLCARRESAARKSGDSIGRRVSRPVRSVKTSAGRATREAEKDPAGQVRPGHTSDRTPGMLSPDFRVAAAWLPGPLAAAGVVVLAAVGGGRPLAALPFALAAVAWTGYRMVRAVCPGWCGLSRHGPARSARPDETCLRADTHRQTGGGTHDSGRRLKTTGGAQVPEGPTLGKVGPVTQPAVVALVKTTILALPILDGALVAAFHDWRWGVAVAALAVPAWLTGRWFHMT